MSPWGATVFAWRWWFLSRVSSCVVMMAMMLVGLAHAQPGLRGVAIAARSRKPIAGVRVTADSLTMRTTLPDGTFDFGILDPGRHELLFEHVAYLSRRVAIEWPVATPFTVELEPRVYQVAPVKVTGERTIPSLPVSAVTFDRGASALTAGNIASDPLRTVQAHPSAATAGIDFLSAMSIRGGDTEELRVYFEQFPLRHYAHLGGFSSVVYDDMLKTITLVPGAPPPRYHGALSGIIVFTPQEPDTHSVSLRYDITSLAAGINHVLSPTVKVQASGKFNTFNLPVYQQVGVDDRSFRDFLGRVIWSPNESLTVTPTLLLATDSESGSPLSTVSRQRETSSAIAGVDIDYRFDEWGLSLQPQYSYFRSSDELTWRATPYEHVLNEARLAGEIARQGSAFGLAINGEVESIQHQGYGGDRSDIPFAAAGEFRYLLRDAAALVLGAGVTREEWTSNVAPEAYGSLRVNLTRRLSLQGALRRSHQTPFVFSDQRYFASIPIDAGDLMNGYDPDEEVHSVRMDQASVEAHVQLPYLFSLEGNGFWRAYDALPTWDWSSFPLPLDVGHRGSGHGDGYEVVLARHDPDRFSFAVTMSRARVSKREGTLSVERPGDYDKPDAWQATSTVRLSEDLRISVRWTDVSGLPFTSYTAQSTPPPDEQVNAERLERFQRLDVKLSVETYSEPFHVTVFLDLVNLLNHKNIATMYALELSEGVFTSAPYGGTSFFPIGGVTVRW